MNNYMRRKESNQSLRTVNTFKSSNKTLYNVTQIEDNWALSMLEEVETTKDKDLKVRHDLKKERNNCTGLFGIFKNLFCACSLKDD